MVNFGEFGGCFGIIGRVDDFFEYVGDYVSCCFIYCCFIVFVVVDGVVILSGNGSDVVWFVVSFFVGKGGVRSGDL